MSFKYQELLQKHNLSPDNLSVALRKKIADLHKVETAIPDAEEQVQSGNLSVAKKAELEEQIEASKAAIPEMDEEITVSIEKWMQNRENYQAVGQRLAEARKNKRAANQQSSARTNKTPSSSSSPATVRQTPAAIPEKTGKVEKAGAGSKVPATSDEKNGSSGWGWLLIGLAGVILGIGGIHLAKTIRERQNQG